MELSVLNIQGADTGRKVVLSDAIFGIEPNDHAIYLDVKQFLANQRQGTHKTKERWEINRTTKKLKRQKGTGGARAGSMKSPLFRGGGRIFGPKPRDYGFKLNKKVKQLARKSALAHKAKLNEIVVVEDFNLQNPKTKDFVNILANLKLADKKAVFVLPEVNNNVVLSSRNIPNSKVVLASDLNTYSILDNQSLVLAENSVKVLENILSSK
ncbi:MAG: 50S ribosomal protein L4 [Bacteroidota bacterium]|jgi:large subunit ribosomal protein L4|nr:MAG: 50S ribosomal protein L4 [Bacteroidota bacterium]